MSFDCAKWKQNSRLADLYLKIGGRYVKGPFEGFSRAQRRKLMRMERVGGRSILAGFQARQRAKAIEAKLEELRDGKSPARREEHGFLQRAAGAIGGIFGRGRQKK